MKLNNASFITQADSGTLAGAWISNTGRLSFGNDLDDDNQWTGTVHKAIRYLYNAAF